MSLTEQAIEERRRADALFAKTRQGFGKRVIATTYRVNPDGSRGDEIGKLTHRTANANAGTTPAKLVTTDDGVAVGKRFEFCGDLFIITSLTPDHVTASCGQFGGLRGFRRKDVAHALAHGVDCSPIKRESDRQRASEKNTLGFAHRVMHLDRPRYVEDERGNIDRIGGAWPHDTTREVDAEKTRIVVPEKAVKVTTVDGKLVVSIGAECPTTTTRKPRAGNPIKGSYDPSI